MFGRFLEERGRELSPGRRFASGAGGSLFRGFEERRYGVVCQWVQGELRSSFIHEAVYETIVFASGTAGLLLTSSSGAREKFSLLFQEQII